MNSRELCELTERAGFENMCRIFEKARNIYTESYSILIDVGVDEDKARSVAAKLSDMLIRRECSK